MSRIALAFAAFLALAVHAQAPEPAASPPARIQDVAWLEGYWVGEGMGGTIEDAWLPAKSGVMLGLFRLVRSDGKPGFYEILGIEETAEGSLRLAIKHFNPDWVGWEEKDKAMTLRLTHLSPTEAAFGGVVFQRPSESALVVQLTLRGKDGAQRQQTLSFRRKPL